MNTEKNILVGDSKSGKYYLWVEHAIVKLVHQFNPPFFAEFNSVIDAFAFLNKKDKEFAKNGGNYDT